MPPANGPGARRSLGRNGRPLRRPRRLRAPRDPHDLRRSPSRRPGDARAALHTPPRLPRTEPASDRLLLASALPLSGSLEDVLAVTRAHQLEGIVTKRLDAPYTPGRRTGAWLKHKHRRRETFAVTGWRPGRASARRPDAILLARRSADGSLHPAGAAELGLRGEERDRLREAHAQRHLSTR